MERTVRSQILHLAVAACLIASTIGTAAVLAQETVRSPSGKRIVGGEPADIQQHPWQVALVIQKSNGRFVCGGSIIALGWVLTAAHCVMDNARYVLGERVQARAGVTYIRTDHAWPLAEKVVAHEKYDASTHEHDIALIKLKSHPNGRIIPLAGSAISLRTGHPLEVTGWGATSEGGRSAGSLLKAMVPYVDNSTCNAPTSYDGGVLVGMMCAGRMDGGVDACQGDSGGPLVWRDGPYGPVLVGIVSFGDGCARKLKYGVYTRVSAYRDWINSVILSRDN